jgi:hypothetical protein
LITPGGHIAFKVVLIIGGLTVMNHSTHGMHTTAIATVGITIDVGYIGFGSDITQVGSRGNSEIIVR